MFVVSFYILHYGKLKKQVIWKFVFMVVITILGIVDSDDDQIENIQVNSYEQNILDNLDNNIRRKNCVPNGTDSLFIFVDEDIENTESFVQNVQHETKLFLMHPTQLLLLNLLNLDLSTSSAILSI